MQCHKGIKNGTIDAPPPRAPIGAAGAAASRANKQKRPQHVPNAPVAVAADVADDADPAPSDAPPIVAEGNAETTPDVFYDYAVLCGKGVMPPGVVSSKKEWFLSDDEFKTHFQMDKVTFYALPRWRRKKLKAVVNLW